MRFIITFILSSCFLPLFARQATVTGPSIVQPGEIAYYQATFAIGLNSQTIVSWNVSGGIIMSQTTNPSNSVFEAWVQWDNANRIGTLDIYEDLGGQNGSAAVLIGTPPVTPALQSLNFGTIPQAVCIEMPASLQDYSVQWEESTDLSNWTAISGEINMCYQPPAIAVSKFYRAVVTVNNNPLYAEPVEVRVNPLSAGVITLNQQPAYNTGLSISNTAAAGGYCSSGNYQYAWEVSVEGGTWTTIGTSVGYPSNAPPIIGDMLVRRKVSCGSEVLYSNTLNIKLNYTSVDYENLNYVRAYTIATKGVQSRYQADQLDVGKKFQETSYLDGFGRPVQSVSKGVSSDASNAWNDMVSFAKYDKQGRTPITYLPYPTTANPGKFKTSVADQVTFYTNNFNEENPWNISETDNSPLNRVTKSIDVGNYRITNDINTAVGYDFNNANGVDEKVHVWRIGYAAGSLPVTSATDVYQQGTLGKITITDQNGKKVIQYKDNLGNIVLEKTQLQNTGTGLSNEHSGWLCTYRVYDGFNRLRYIITPKAVAYLDTHDWIFNQSLADELCFYYEYDVKGRVLVTKKPGSVKSTAIYDQRDRVVLTQDGNQAAKNPAEWSVILYDELDRVVQTGVYKTGKSQSQLQTELDNAAQASAITIIGPGDETLTVNGRSSTPTPPSKYTATKEVNLVEPFASLENDDFTVEIGPVIGTVEIKSVVYNPIPQADLGNPAVYTALTYNYYDDYSFPGAKSFDNTYTNLQAYTTADPDVEAIAKSVRTLSMSTGSRVRVLGTSTFLASTVYYDEEGAVIQSLGDNYKNGVDIATNQYHFDKRVLSVSSKHGNPGNAFDGFTTLTKNEYDKIGRLKITWKKYASAAFVKLSEITYDELGHIKQKKIGKKPNTVDDPLETLDYSYNVHGLLTGINKDYALSSNNSDQWNRYFGLYLGYENYDNKFANGRYDGLVTGLIWKTQGDNVPRMYDFSYDNAKRYIAADFKQKSKPSETTWTNSSVDFSENNITYDENGNIKQLFRKGIQPANNSALYIDKLIYTYKSANGGEWSNQLRKVFDNNPDIGSSANGKLGDFKDEVYGTDSDDYLYDNNGNLVKDNNKKIRNGSGDGIVYNYLNKPERIILENKSTVEYTYDALGIKLAKKVTPVSGTAYTTYYVNEFIYQDNDLQFILNKEGRVRVIDQISTTSPLGASAMIINGNVQLTTTKWGVFDYFIKDHLGSTRLVLSEEYHKEIYKATMETAAAPEEERLFGKVDDNGNPDPGNELAQTRVANSSIWTSNATAQISKLVTISGNTSRSIGPNVLLKVMAGDYISPVAKYYYDVPSGNVNNDNILSPLVNSLIGGLSAGGVAPVIKDGAASLQSVLGNTSASPLLPILNSRPSAPSDRPKAYLNYIFFDENFNVVENAGGADMVKANDNDDMVGLTNIKVPKNGYVYVYLSNESDWPVYFDDFTVAHERGAIIEESHYYPFGQKIAGISSRAFNKLPNRYGFQGVFSEEEEESGYDEFDLRMYDPQIARWIQTDPYDEFASPYLGMGNDPVNNVDPSGGGTSGLFADLDIFESAAAGAVLGGIIGGVAGLIGGGDNAWSYAGIGAAVGGGLGAGANTGAMPSASGIAEAVLAAIAGNPLRIIQTIVYVANYQTHLSDVHYGPVQTSHGPVETGIQSLGGDAKDGIELTLITYNFPSLEADYNDRKEVTKFIPYKEPIPNRLPPPTVPPGPNITIRPACCVISARFVPEPPPPPPLVRLRVDFTRNSDKLKPASGADAMKKIAALAKVLKDNPAINIALVGNGGLDAPAPGTHLGPPTPASTEPNSATLNGASTTEAVLFRARAETIRDILIKNFKISPRRVTTKAGSLFPTPAGRNVEVIRTN